MTPNDDLARWGEPPASEQEMRAGPEARRAPAAHDRGSRRARRPAEVDSWLELMVTTVLTYSGLAENAHPARPRRTARRTANCECYRLA